MNKHAVVIGGGFAGVEAAAQLLRCGIDTTLYEMKPLRFSPAHSNKGLAELVCSNSFKAERIDSASGLLKAEMRRFDSICLECADEARVPAGGALAVDRDKFSELVTERLGAFDNIDIIRKEICDIPDADAVIVAAGPLMSEALSEKISEICGGMLSFFDAAAPIISADSIDMSCTFTQSRYDRGEADDYINCPLNKEEYEIFVDELINAQSADLHEADNRGVYEGCMPIEIMAKRGKDTLRFGPMKPVGLTDPETGHRPWAVLQLRKENKAGTMYNLVGFQTNLKFGEQKRVFSMIPALKNAVFERYGVMHRNSFINSPELLGADFAIRKNNPIINGKKIFFAGQITGVEGYMESAASGIMAGINAAAYLLGKSPFILPEMTMMGALASYISTPFNRKGGFQPMGAAFGLMPPLDMKIRDKKERYLALAKRSLLFFERYGANHQR